MRNKSCISTRMFFDGWIGVSGLGSDLSLFAGVVVPLASSCSSMVQSDCVQCSTNDDCIRRGAAFANSICVDELCAVPTPPDPWGCLGHSPSAVPPPGSVTLTGQLDDGTNVGGLTIFSRTGPLAYAALVPVSQ